MLAVPIVFFFFKIISSLSTFVNLQRSSLSLGRFKSLKPLLCSSITYFENINNTESIAKLRKLAPMTNHAAFQQVLTSLKDQHQLSSAAIAQILNNVSLNHDPNYSRKSMLHLAAWRGPIENVISLLKNGADIDMISKNIWNYGKSAIFYAITRCRDDIAIELLNRGANVKIINNKGQTPLSIAITHLKRETCLQIALAENKEKEWVDYRLECVDDREYGDLDPRFNSNCDRDIDIDSSNIINYDFQDNAFPFDILKTIKPTTKESRQQRTKNRMKNIINIKEQSTVLLDTSIETLQSSETEINANIASTSSSINTMDNKYDDNINLYLIPVEITGKVLRKRQMAKTFTFIDIDPILTSEIEEGVYLLPQQDNEQLKQKRVQLIIGKTMRETMGANATSMIIKNIKINQTIAVSGFINTKIQAVDDDDEDVIDIRVKQLKVLNNASNSTNEFIEYSKPYQEFNQDIHIKNQISDTKTPIDSSFISSFIITDSDEIDNVSHNKYITLQNVMNELTTTTPTTTNLPPFSIPSNVEAYTTATARSILLPSPLSASPPLFATSTTTNNNPTHQSSPYVLLVDDVSKIEIFVDFMENFIKDATETNAMKKSSMTSFDDNSREQTYIDSTDNVTNINNNNNSNRSSNNSYFKSDKFVVGVDCEWQPDSDQKPVQTLQLAIRNATFIMDLAAIRRLYISDCIAGMADTIDDVNTYRMMDTNVNLDFYSSFINQETQQQPLYIIKLNYIFNKLFQSQVIHILGFNIYSDLLALSTSYASSIFPAFLQFYSVIDLSYLAKIAFPDEAENNINSLSKLSYYILGKSMNKKQQCSDWHKRPLTGQQIEYAALDASILILLFDKIMSTSAVMKSFSDPMEMIPMLRLNWSFWISTLDSEMSKQVNIHEHKLTQTLKSHFSITKRSSKSSSLESLQQTTRHTRVKFFKIPYDSTTISEFTESTSSFFYQLVLSQSWCVTDSIAHNESYMISNNIQSFVENSLFSTLSTKKKSKAKKTETSKIFLGFSDNNSNSNSNSNSKLCDDSSSTLIDSQTNDPQIIRKIINSIKLDLDDTSNSSLMQKCLGKIIRGSKKGCVRLCLENSIINNFENLVDVHKLVNIITTINFKKGFFEFGNTLCLFINCLTNPKQSASLLSPERSIKRSPYANEFPEVGRYVTWFIQSNLWDNGHSKLAMKLMSGDSDNDSFMKDNNKTNILLFIRGQKDSYIFCGRCRYVNATINSYNSDNNNEFSSDFNKVQSKSSQLVKILFELVDYTNVIRVHDHDHDDNSKYDQFNSYLSIIQTHNKILNNK